MTRTVHLAVYDTLADWEVGHTTAHINSGAWQPTRTGSGSPPWARRSTRSPRWAA